MQQFDNFTFPCIRKDRLFCLLFILVFGNGCGNNDSHKEMEASSPPIHLITLAPGHFHAALLQKSMYSQVDSTVYVFAPEGPELQSHLALVNGYNHRSEKPTGWEEKVYTGPDYLDKLLKTKPGNLVIIAGNNQLKTDYITKAVDAGLNVLADKPMAISTAGFAALRDAFANAEKNGVFLYDIMTERYEITNRLMQVFCSLPDVFGELQKGTLKNPAITAESVHYFFKEVSGAPLVRPAWFFDVQQEGEGIVDVTTHVVDLIQWQCFPEQTLEYKKDIRMLAASHWPTVLTPTQFRQVTKKDRYPEFLRKDVKDSLLSVYANGEMNYTIRDIHAKVSVSWQFKAPEGTGDSFNSKLLGTKARLVIRQGKEQDYEPTLYIEPVQKTDLKNWNVRLRRGLDSIQKEYPGVDLKESKGGWEVLIPEHHKVGHEQHFAEVFKKYIRYFLDGKIPDWEIAAMLAKYYTTTQAIEKATTSVR